MSVYYNENDPYCVRWLQNLRDAGHIPRGLVDGRSIKEIRSEDTRETSHFFAGIGGWPLALSLAGWPEDRPVWTGSCPCQPFSQAGLRKGVADERHLWPDFRRLIVACKPPTIFGEQVASPLGRRWLAQVRLDLENIEYWQRYYETLHEVLAAKTLASLSTILGQIVGWVEATVPNMPAPIRNGMARAQQEQTEKTSGSESTQRASVPFALRRHTSRRVVGQTSGSEMQKKEGRVRSRPVCERDRSTDAERKMRTDRIAPQFLFSRDVMEQPIVASDRPKTGIYLPQHPSCMLWNERCAWELGGVGATANANCLVTEEMLGDELSIAEIFGALVEASVERLRIVGIRSDLEALEYVVGAADLCAAGAGAPHIRQRLWWVANAGLSEPPRRIPAATDNDRSCETRGVTGREPTPCSSDGGLADTLPAGWAKGGAGAGDRQASSGSGISRMAVTDGGHAGAERLQRSGQHGQQPQDGGTGGLGDSPSEQVGRARQPRQDGFWDAFDLIPCGDGKARRVEPGTFPLAHGVSQRVGKLRAYGNAIVPQVAAKFIAAYLEATHPTPR